MYSKTKIIGLSLVAFLGLAATVEAGRIGPVEDQASPSHSSGYGGWNLGNVNVKITDLDYIEGGKTFEPTDGSYSPDMVLGDSFESDIYEGIDASGTVLVNLHGKDWPVGEPAGIKIMNHTDPTATLSHSKPASCIMTTSYFDIDPEDNEGNLDADIPTETQCNSTFQSHKRFKLNMLPSMVADVNMTTGGYAKGVDLTFNVEAETGTRRYQVLLKANNYTDVRLDGFKIEVGFIGADGNFTTASDAGADIRLSIGEGEDIVDGGAVADIWGVDELATFSHGLWGAASADADTNPDAHFPANGFFGDTPAGYTVELNDANDTITSTGTLGGTYTAIPVPYGTVGTQFGQWLPSIWEPTGIFWDDDNDPATDATIMAFWGDRGDGNYTWMKGNDVDFDEASAEELLGWASSPVFEIGGIEDVLNLGLNYIVEVGDITTFPDSEFTIRLTPRVPADANISKPGYVDNTRPPMSTYLDSNGTVHISPAPTFTIGEPLEIVVADKDLDSSSPIDVNVSVDGTWTMVTLNGVIDRSIFTATLATIVGTTVITDSNITLQEGSVVTVTYTDENYGGTGEAEIIATTTATVTPVVSSSSKGIFSTMDNASLFAMIFGFLAIGGIIARKKLAA